MSADGVITGSHEDALEDALTEGRPEDLPGRPDATIWTAAVDPATGAAVPVVAYGVVR
ncbi:hypothetical protein [Streptomyces sp. PsTaAH-124]|uniref:hypothetical protein n=1 Tax=Streptomyces sp. PsTaAH-124 TaxID=1157638 RepID=UPI001319F42D|nr:hypothetical protein [Streptomyces sp. PsTaAH-124]